MLIGNLVLFCLAALALLGSPGSLNLNLAGVGAVTGPASNMAYLKGIIAGTISVLAVIAAAVSIILLAIPTLVIPLAIIGSIYLMFQAWQIATAPASSEEYTETFTTSFNLGFLTLVTQPSAYAAIGALFISHRIVDYSILYDSIAKFVALYIIIIVVNIIWVTFGSSIGSALNNREISQKTNRIFGAMLAVTTILALLYWL